MDLFGEVLKAEALKEVYKAVDEIRKKFGKHAVFLGASFKAQTHAQHAEREANSPDEKPSSSKESPRAGS